ncbi:MAG: DUF4058 family protein [Pirellulaceae bacterium]
MPSPFPGMDPFLEMEEWGDFHHTLMSEIKVQLVPQIIPKYVAIVERRVYLEHLDDEIDQFLPDVNVVKVGSDDRQRSAVAVMTAPATGHKVETYFAPMPFEHREPYLLIRDRESNEIVTVIELLSPANKTKNADGNREYNEKRESLLRSSANLVEIDLLRAGLRPATTKPLRDTTDYCAMVHRVKRRPAIDVIQWTLRQPLPKLAIPLSNGDPDANLDLQVGFGRVYDTSAYQLLLKYNRTLKPPIRPGDEAWLASTLSQFNQKL